jgi:flagellar motility protein MotE (MotC chaperone)
MRSVAVVSMITFIAIFGSTVLIGTRLVESSRAAAVASLPVAELAAAEQTLADLSLEQEQMQSEREDLLALHQAAAAENKILAERRMQLEAAARELDAKQTADLGERERSAIRLARMYEVMKPQQAAPIMASLDLEVVLEIMVRMRERPAGRILARMDPGYAARISTHLSARQSSP